VFREASSHVKDGDRYDDAPEATRRLPAPSRALPFALPMPYKGTVTVSMTRICWPMRKLAPFNIAINHHSPFDSLLPLL
jgi:hypothetical protein